MKRRHFLALSAGLPFFAKELLGGTGNSAAHAGAQPSLLVTPRDPFSGIELLKARCARGKRPSEDVSGWALSWLLLGDEQSAEKAVAHLKADAPPSSAQPGRAWVDFVAWSLAFDWLSGFSGFDESSRRHVAERLLDGGEKTLARPDLADPSQVSYHNYALRYLALAAFTVAASSRCSATAKRAMELMPRVDKAFSNVLDLTELVTPEGSYHESMDYSRITWVPLALMAELWRSTTGFDPAQRCSLFRNMGRSYLYKLMPDGTPSREGDNEYPILDASDTTVLGYAVHRFKDPYAAWLLRDSGFVPGGWRLPVLSFLWNDDQVAPRDPVHASERELPRQKYFPGVGHLVMRTGWTPESTWIEFDSGPYLAKHQHLSQNQFTIFHRGYLAIDSGADYTDTESPHYLNYYRRSIAHNTLLVFDPEEKFFWSENVVAAANDGGQRMNSSRFWNSVRSMEDWERTKDLWDLARMRVVDHVPGRYHYALGDASRAYSTTKLKLFTRELFFHPASNILFVFDRVHTTRPEFAKTWLLHGVNEPAVDGDAMQDGHGGTAYRHASTFRFQEADGELLVHSLLPHERVIVRRGGPGFDFWTPGNEHGGPWGSGENWPLESENGSELPSEERLHSMWKKFWGEDFERILPSNRKNVRPGGWRIEVSPTLQSNENVFLHVIEIGNKGMKGRKVELLEGVNVAGAIVADGPAVLFVNGAGPIHEAEVTLPAVSFESLVVTGLEPNGVYDLHLTGPNIAASQDAASPGVPVKTMLVRANEKGIAPLEIGAVGNVRLRMLRV